MLEVEDAVVRFGAHTAVDRVVLTVAPGETLAVLGPSGCGKTTLLRAIAGLQPLDAGRVCWDGNDLAAVPPHDRRFGLMFQEYALFPHRDVQGNVEFGLRMAGAARTARARRVEDVLALVGLREFRDRPVATLSGGEQQRVALARALVVEPRLLMLDEPLGALDRAWRAQLIEEIRGLLDRATLPAIYVTHDHDEAFTIASLLAVMRAGRVVQQGTPAEVWRRPVDAWTARFFGFGPATACTVRGGFFETPWGRLPAPAGTPEGCVDLVFRPDALRLDTAGSLAGIVTATTFTGELVTLTVQPVPGAGLTVRVPQRDAPAVGDRVCLAVDGDGLLAYGQTDR